MDKTPFELTDWNQVPPESHSGDPGSSSCKVVERDGVRMRMVEYSPGYRADHWCDRGHVVLVLDGAITMELDDGRSFDLKPGMSFHVGDGLDAHRVYSASGAKVFIVD